MVDDDTAVSEMRPSDRRMVDRILDARDRRYTTQSNSFGRDGRAQNIESRAYLGIRDLMEMGDEGNHLEKR